jgi:hypothetical protein
MCYVIQNVISGIMDMQNDMVQDGEMPRGLNNEDYYRAYLIDCMECSEPMADLISRDLVSEGVEYIENLNGTHYQADLEKRDTHFYITISRHGVGFVNEYYIPIKNGEAHETMAHLVLAEIADKYNNVLWF